MTARSALLTSIVVSAALGGCADMQGIDHRASLEDPNALAATKTLAGTPTSLVERITQFDPTSTQALARLQAGGPTPEQAGTALNQVIDRQAFMLSANDIFFVSALLFRLLIGVVWLARPVSSQASTHLASEA